MGLKLHILGSQTLRIKGSMKTLTYEQANEMLSKNKHLYTMESQSGRLQDDLLATIIDKGVIIGYLCQFDCLGYEEDKYNDRLMGIY